jgi:hypothetical protein
MSSSDLCNYILVGGNLSYVRSVEKTADDAACVFREKGSVLFLISTT